MHAAGVNFRDVLLALGMYPDNAGLLGSEGAGTVLEIGSGVIGMAPGDRVMGLFSGAFGPVAITDHRLVAPVPADWSFPRAAATPIAFLTAMYALVDLADVRGGESVLVHAAAGGVGMAAVQVAHWLGAEVFATASPAKWDAVRACGVAPQRIASSRSTEFAEHFRSGAPGGVDVVLNSLTGELLDSSLGLLRPGGRLIEMGRTDLRDAEEVLARHGVSYRAFELLDEAPTGSTGCSPNCSPCSNRACSPRCHCGSRTYVRRMMPSAISPRRGTSASWPSPSPDRSPAAPY